MCHRYCNGYLKQAGMFGREDCSINFEELLRDNRAKYFLYIKLIKVFMQDFICKTAACFGILSSVLEMY